MSDWSEKRPQTKLFWVCIY